ncbi:MAG: Uncharacterized protein CEO21_217 [Microgenomates group bacterium Gr01-1014_80]|nr:MAG: Uncharacterized protein CEO21_217 [Microgenomates group bacterium Gr01-1014_80]
MLPVLFSIGPITISSFGLFLSLGFIYGSFLVWRLARAWELSEEKALDLIILTFFGGLIGARLFFVALNFEFFANDLFKIFLATKYPGLSFWGGFLGGWLTLFIFARRLKFNFLQIADLAAVGFLGGLILADIGCFLGGCGVGKVSNAFFAVPIVGLVGKRFPVQIFEAVITGLILLRIWPAATHFHNFGKVVSLSLISLGLVKLVTEYFRAAHQGGYFLSLAMFALGMVMYYSSSNKSPVADAKSLFRFILGFFIGTKSWNLVLEGLKKNWYNFRISFNWKLKKSFKVLRRARVKPTPRDI